MRRTLLFLSLPLALGLWAACGRFGSERPNILFISIDSLRADHLGCYGRRSPYAPDVPISPRIDGVAAEGVQFLSAWSTTSWTLASHAAMMTGLSDREHALEMDHLRLDPKRETLAECFQRAGYATGGVYSGPYLGENFGYKQGFDIYESAMADEKTKKEIVERQAARARAEGLDVTPQVIAGWLEQISHLDVTSDRVTERGAAFLERFGGREPFFLFLHYFDVHYDLVPPGEYATMFDPDYQGTMTGRDFFGNPAIWNEAEQTRVVGERDLGHLRALYDGEVRWVDSHVGRLLDLLEAKGLRDNTIIAIVSDHGDEFFEHGGRGHRSTLYRELTRVPFLLLVPGKTDAGSRVRETVRLYDLAPTLLDYAGLDPMEEAAGRSLRPLLEGDPEETRPVLHRLVFYGKQPDGAPYENLRDGYRDDDFFVQRQFRFAPPRADRKSALVRADVFDLRQDPHEQFPLPQDDPRYGKALARFAAEWRRAEQHRSSLPRSAPADRGSDMSEEQQRSLEALGYTGAGGIGDDEEALLDLPAFPEPGKQER